MDVILERDRISNQQNSMEIAQFSLDVCKECPLLSFFDARLSVCDVVYVPMITLLILWILFAFPLFQFIGQLYDFTSDSHQVIKTIKER